MTIKREDITPKKIDKEMIEMLNDHELKLNNIPRIPGHSAYEVALEQGYTGTEKEWLKSLQGLTTTIQINGHVYEQQNGTITLPNYTLSNDETIENLQDGLSAYEIAVKNGFDGTETEWLESLKGTEGKSAYEVALEQGYTGTEKEWLKSLKGVDGSTGKSHYEIAVMNGYTGTQMEWLESLKGADGVSAYKLAVLNGYTGTEKEWLESLKGEKGDQGETVSVTYNGITYEQIDGNIVLPVAQALILKDIFGNTLNYNGNKEVDISSGVYYAKTSETASSIAQPLAIQTGDTAAPTTQNFNGSALVNIDLCNATATHNGLMTTNQVKTLETATNNINTIQTAQSNQQITLDTHTSQVTALQNDLANTKSTLSAAQSNITVAQSNIKTLQSNIVTLQTLYNALKEEGIMKIVLASDNVKQSYTLNTYIDTDTAKYNKILLNCFSFISRFKGYVKLKLSYSSMNYDTYFALRQYLCAEIVKTNTGKYNQLLNTIEYRDPSVNSSSIVSLPVPILSSSGVGTIAAGTVEGILAVEYGVAYTICFYAYGESGYDQLGYLKGTLYNIQLCYDEV